MKNVLYSIALCILLLTACQEKEQNVNVEKPQPVTEVTFEPNLGGGIIRYALPDDETVSFVKACYTLNNGKEVTRASSYFSDFIEIDGYDDSDDHVVTISTVNFSGVSSDPVTITINTLGSPLEAIAGTFEVAPYFSSAKVSWDNETGATIQIVAEIEFGGKTVIQSMDTNSPGRNSMSIQNLNAEDYTIRAYVKDIYDNESSKVNLGTIKPYVDYKIDKTAWNYVGNDQLPEGLHNADIIFQEGRLTKFWDDEIDDATKDNLNFFVAYQGYPFSYFLDMGRPIRISRFRVWQRDEIWSGPHFYYQGSNVKTFELWVSNDKVNWTKIRRATIVEPSNSATALEEARAGHEFIVYEDDPHFTDTFRYLEFRGIESFGDNSSGCLSEITLYGVEEKDF